MRHAGWPRTLGAVLLAGILAAPALAQDGPAELPPDDFAGRQFVDSQGCVFIRAEVAGVVTWVPRLNRDREVLCGLPPTFADGTGATGGSLPVPVPDAPPVAAAPPPPPPAAEEPVIVAEAEPEPEPAPVVRTAPARQAKAPAKVPRRATSGGSTPPRGYVAVWDDGRLNPHRGPRTAAGDAAMNRIWTDTVPMRLVGN